MNTDAHGRELEESLMELSRDIIYPTAPDVTSRVRARIAVQPKASRRPNLGRLAALGVVAVVVILASVLALSPDARATLMPWWTAGSSCPGPITGKPLHMTTVSAGDLCRIGIVLTQPNGKALVSRDQAILAVYRNTSRWLARETVLATIHDQSQSPPRYRLVWVISTLSPYEADLRPSQLRSAVRLVFFVDARSGRIFDQVRTITSGPAPIAGVPPYTYSTVLFTSRQDGFILAMKNPGIPYLFSTTDGGRTWIRRITLLYAGWFQFVNASDGWLIGSPDCGCDHPILGLYRTRNAGRTWRKLVTLPRGYPQIQFVSSRKGWMQFNGASILETSNDGATWRPSDWPFKTDDWSFRNANVGWAEARVGHQPVNTGCTLSQLYVTFNSGRTWSKRPAAPGCYTLPSFANRRDGWMLVDPDQYQLFIPPSNCFHDYGCPEALLQTADGGRTWTTEHPVTQDEPPPGSLGHKGYWPGGATYGLQTPVFVDAHHGWMVTDNPGGGAPPLRGSSGGVATTVNGGATWHLHHLGFGQLQLAPTSGRDAWVTVLSADVQPNQSYVLHTTDGGRRWKIVHFRSVMGRQP